MSTAPTPGRCFTCGAALVPHEHIGRSIWYCPSKNCPAHGRLVEAKAQPETAKP